MCGCIQPCVDLCIGVRMHTCSYVKLLWLLRFFLQENSATGTRTRVARVRAEYPNQLDYSGFWQRLYAHVMQLCHGKYHALRGALSLPPFTPPADPPGRRGGSRAKGSLAHKPFTPPSSPPPPSPHPSDSDAAAQGRADSTLRSSQAVPHPSTNRALCRLTSEVGRDPVYSTRYGRQRI